VELNEFRLLVIVVVVVVVVVVGRSCLLKLLLFGSASNRIFVRLGIEPSRPRSH